MNKLVLSAVVVVVLSTACAAVTGVDVSSLFSQDAWNCIHKSGYDFAIVRCYRSIDSPDPNCAPSISRAWNAGMKRVDAYMFPCAKCGNYSGQVQRFYDHLHSNNVKYSGVWLDIEGIGTQWYDDKSKNRVIFDSFMTAAKKIFGKEFVGCYVSQRSWHGIFGDDYKAWGDLKVWFAKWDHTPGPGNWTPYGGFKSATIHQYEGDATVCKSTVDLDYVASLDY